MSGDILILGNVVFDNVLNPFAIPSKISGGSGQMLGVMKLIGGDRTIDSMGPDPESIGWSGRWRAPLAVSNNDAMVAMAEAGAQIPCTWGSYFFNVVIAKYTYEYEAFFEIPYTVSLTVLPQNSGQGGSTSLDMIIGTDMSAALGVGAFQ